MYQHIKTIITTTLLASSLNACSDKSDEQDIPVSSVPANIVSTVQNSLPGISLTEAEKEVKGNVTVYELEGTLITGEKYEIKITDSGTLLKIELED